MSVGKGAPGILTRPLCRVTTTIASSISTFQRDQDPSSPADAELCARHQRAHNIALIQIPGLSIGRANADPSNQVFTGFELAKSLDNVKRQ